jgi:hypothetical protein
VSVNVGAVAGLVLFLEEDHFVAEDFIHVLRLMERTCRTSCDRCNILSLGTYLKTYNYYGESKKVGRSCSIAMFSTIKSLVYVINPITIMTYIYVLSLIFWFIL